MKYKPLYKVTLNGETIGYVENKNEFENAINKMVTVEEECVAFRTIEAEQNYELQFVEKTKQVNEQEVLAKIQENTTTIYTMFGIVVNDEIKTYVKTEEEAQNVIEELNQKCKEKNIEIEIGMRQIYTDTKQDTEEGSVIVAKIEDETIAPLADITKKQEKQEEQKAISTVNGIQLAVRPISGTITSRYGARSSRRSGAHTGLDIAAKTGTPIKVTTDGSVTFAGRSGSYGYLVKVSHGNGVETWYAHCSKLYVSKGQAVSAGDTIAAVGSTGNSTGPHLHFEIRVDGKTLNPQKYIY